MSKEILINIVGDFCVSRLDNLSFGNKLKTKLSEGDINIVNLEAPIKEKGSIAIEKSGPNLFQDNNAIKFLEENGFNVFSLANNHIMDYGISSLLKTKSLIKSATCVGAGYFEDAYRVQKITINGNVIGILAITQYEFGIIDDEDPNSLGTAWLCHPSIDKRIVEAKNDCDFLIIMPHAGLENFKYPLPEIKTLYRHFVEMGADAVIGGHPHIPQCWEFFKEKPIVYSLGNFCFDSLRPKKAMWNKGLLASLTIRENGISLVITKLEYFIGQRLVDLTDNEFFDLFLAQINSNFKDENTYLSIVNKKCLALENTYNQYFEMSGYYKPSLKKYTRLTLGLLKRKMLGRKDISYNPNHMINCLRCETHRWVLSRIYNIHKKQ